MEEKLWVRRAVVTSDELLMLDKWRDANGWTWSELNLKGLGYPFESGKGKAGCKEIKLVHPPSHHAQLMQQTLNELELAKKPPEVLLVGSDGSVPLHRLYIANGLRFHPSARTGTTLDQSADSLFRVLRDATEEAGTKESEVTKILLPDVHVVHLRQVVSLLVHGEAIIEEVDEEEVHQVLQMLELDHIWRKVVLEMVKKVVPDDRVPTPPTLHPAAVVPSTTSGGNVVDSSEEVHAEQPMGVDADPPLPSPQEPQVGRQCHDEEDVAMGNPDSETRLLDLSLTSIRAEEQIQNSEGTKGDPHQGKGGSAQGMISQEGAPPPQVNVMPEVVAAGGGGGEVEQVVAIAEGSVENETIPLKTTSCTTRIIISEGSDGDPPGRHDEPEEPRVEGMIVAPAAEVLLCNPPPPRVKGGVLPPRSPDEIMTTCDDEQYRRATVAEEEEEEADYCDSDDDGVIPIIGSSRSERALQRSLRRRKDEYLKMKTEIDEIVAGLVEEDADEANNIPDLNPPPEPSSSTSTCLSRDDGSDATPCPETSSTRRTVLEQVSKPRQPEREREEKSKFTCKFCSGVYSTGQSLEFDLENQICDLCSSFIGNNKERLASCQRKRNARLENRRGRKKKKIEGGTDDEKAVNKTGGGRGHGQDGKLAKISSYAKKSTSTRPVVVIQNGDEVLVGMGSSFTDNNAERSGELLSLPTPSETGTKGQAVHVKEASPTSNKRGGCARTQFPPPKKKKRARPTNGECSPKCRKGEEEPLGEKSRSKGTKSTHSRKMKSVDASTSKQPALFSPPAQAGNIKEVRNAVECLYPPLREARVELERMSEEQFARMRNGEEVEARPRRRQLQHGWGYVFSMQAAAVVGYEEEMARGGLKPLGGTLQLNQNPQRFLEDHQPGTSSSGTQAKRRKPTEDLDPELRTPRIAAVIPPPPNMSKKQKDRGGGHKIDKDKTKREGGGGGGRNGQAPYPPKELEMIRGEVVNTEPPATNGLGAIDDKEESSTAGVLVRQQQCRPVILSGWGPPPPQRVFTFEEKNSSSLAQSLPSTGLQAPNQKR